MISHGGRFADAAVVVAPILKLCPAYSEELSPPMDKSSLIPIVSVSLVRGELLVYLNSGPGYRKEVLVARYAVIADTGQI